MIIGAHVMLQSRDEEADRAFLSEVLNLASVDAGEGFLIFGVPPAEIAVHDSEDNDVHELFLMCDDIEAFVADMLARGIASTPPAFRGWGTVTEVALPGGGKLGVYQPHHKRPEPHAAHAGKKRAKPARKAAKKAMKKATAKKEPAKRKAAKKKAARR